MPCPCAGCVFRAEHPAHYHLWLAFGFLRRVTRGGLS